MQYVLETFTEGRTTKNAQKPYMGGPVDGPENGPPPPPWAIPCSPHQSFHDHKIKIEVPHTSVVRVSMAFRSKVYISYLLYLFYATCIMTLVAQISSLITSMLYLYISNVNEYF